MKTYYIEIAEGGVRNYENFIVLAREFADALDKAGTYIEIESRKKSNKNCSFEIAEISLKDEVTEIKRISGVYVEPSFK